MLDRLFLGVVQLEMAAQEHRCRGDLLASPSELWGIVPLVHDVVLDLAGATPGAARWVMRMGRNVLHRLRRRRQWLVLPPLSQFLGVLLCQREGPRTRVQRGVSLQRLRYHQRLSQSVRHSALPGWTVARCHATDAGAVALNLIIQEFMESGGSIARHSHEFGCERGRHQRPLEPLSIRVHGGCEAIGEPVVRWLRCGQRGPFE